MCKISCFSSLITFQHQIPILYHNIVSQKYLYEHHQNGKFKYQLRTLVLKHQAFSIIYMFLLKASRFMELRISSLLAPYALGTIVLQHTGFVLTDKH